MNESTFIAQITRIQQHVKNLLRKEGQLVAENELLREKLGELREQIRQHRSYIQELESQKKILKIAKGLDQDPKAKQEARLKINEFIKEIDKTIALLND